MLLAAHLDRIDGLSVARSGGMSFPALAPDIFVRQLRNYHSNSELLLYVLSYPPVNIYYLTPVPRQPYRRSTAFFLSLSRGHSHSAQRNTITASLSLAALVPHRTMMDF